MTIVLTLVIINTLLLLFNVAQCAATVRLLLALGKYIEANTEMFKSLGPYLDSQQTAFTELRKELVKYYATKN